MVALANHFGALPSSIAKSESNNHSSAHSKSDKDAKFGKPNSIPIEGKKKSAKEHESKVCNKKGREYKGPDVLDVSHSSTFDCPVNGNLDND